MMKTTKIIAAVGIALISAQAFTSCNSNHPDKQESKEAVSDTASSSIADTTEAVDKKTETSVKMTPLTIIVTNLKLSDATVELSIYGPESKFPKPDGQLKKYRVEPISGKLELEITDLPYGEYAVAIFQDTDNDGKIDKNMIGIPTERYGFSKNFEPKMKAPNFSDCKFDYNAEKSTINIALLK